MIQSNLQRSNLKISFQNLIIVFKNIFFNRIFEMLSNVLITFVTIDSVLQKPFKIVFKDKPYPSSITFHPYLKDTERQLDKIEIKRIKKKKIDYKINLLNNSLYTRIEINVDVIQIYNIF